MSAFSSTVSSSLGKVKRRLICVLLSLSDARNGLLNKDRNVSKERRARKEPRYRFFAGFNVERKKKNLIYVST